MKKIILLAFAALLLVPCYSQKQNEVGVSYGLLTNEQIISAFLSVGLSVVNGVTGNYTTTNLKSTGGIFLTYRHYNPSGRAAIGLAAGIDNTKGDILDASDNKKGEMKVNSVTVAAEGLVNYVNNENFKLYGLLGAGYTFLNYKYTPSATPDEEKAGHFNFQITPLGIRAGKNAGGFLELGLGYKGVINLGLFARL
jgi:hypothetical protein